MDKDLNSSKSVNNHQMNGLNGCCDGCPQDPNQQQTVGHKTGESANGIQLLCDAVEAIESNGSQQKRTKPQMNGLFGESCSEDKKNNILNDSFQSDSCFGQSSSSCGQTTCGQTNCNQTKTQQTNNSCCCSSSCYQINCSTCSTNSSNCCCCQTVASSPSSSSSSSATTSCCSTSSATLSCDINNKELVVQTNDDNNKDINCLTNRLSTKLNINELTEKIQFVNYESERQMPDIMRLIQKDLSEPYSIYTYRYFIHNWPHLCFLSMDSTKCVGAIVCKLDVHKRVLRGYIAMLAVDENYRKKRIGSNLVLKAIQAMIAGNADEVVLETEVTNKPALQLYENLGFVRDKRLFRYYLNGVDALRLKLWLK